MIVIQDTREKLPLDIKAYTVEIAHLPIGDYGIKGFSDWQNPAFIVERKSMNDLVGSLTRERTRFWAELEKMRQFRFAAVLVEGTQEQVRRGEYRSKATPKSITASLDAIRVRLGIHIIWAGDADGAARQLEALVRQFARGIEKQAKAIARTA